MRIQEAIKPTGKAVCPTSGPYFYASVAAEINSGDQLFWVRIETGLKELAVSYHSTIRDDWEPYYA